MKVSGTGAPQLSRRAFLAATVAGGVALAGCERPTTAPKSSSLADAIAAAEAARPHTGRTVTAALNPGRANVDLGGTMARTLAYNNIIPGPLIRANAGDELYVTVTNGLDHAASVHWHGIALRNDMDGAVPAVAQYRPRQAVHLPVHGSKSRHVLGTPPQASTPTTGRTCQ